MGFLMGRAWSRVTAQNPFEQLAVGALSVGGQIMNSLQEGALATQQMNFDTGLVAMRSKTAMGYGDAMRPVNDDDSSESDERRRRRRRRRSMDGNNSIISLHQALHRIRRSPCNWKQMMGATTEMTDDDIEARRRRARKRAANNASKTRVTKSKTKTKKKLLETRRRRRQALESPQQESVGANLGERVKGFFLSFMGNVGDMMQQMGQKIKGTAAQITNSTR
ncbi:uncharacterized protein LOC6564524 [Drosophila grimshawi]|nr:uncharacterized protein LOC6564524 [Drosophila grimshawi]